MEKIKIVRKLDDDVTYKVGDIVELLYVYDEDYKSLEERDLVHVIDFEGCALAIYAGELEGWTGGKI